MKLSVLRANKLVTEIDLENEIAGLEGDQVFFIGRSEDCHIQLDDKQVSREHAQILFKNGNWEFASLSDSGIILLNGNPCRQSELQNGDILNIGPFTLNVLIRPIRPMGVLLEEETVAIPLAKTSPQQVSSPVSTPSVQDKGGQTQSETLTSANEEEVTGEISQASSDDHADPFGQSSEENPNFDETLGNTAAPAGEVSSAEVPMSFSDENLSESGDGFGDANLMPSSDDGSTRVFKSFASFKLEIVGEYAPYDSFNIESAETFIGRDPAKCQIVLKDPEVSSVHAVLRKNNITCVLEDLKSANGTILNAQRINKSDLTTGDEFIIGSTTFTFQVQSDLLNEEENRLMPVDEDQEIEVVEEVEETVEFGENTGVNALGGEGADAFGAAPATQEKSIIKRILKDPAQRKKAIYGLLILVVLWVVLDDSGKKPTPKKPPQTTTQNNLLPGAEGTKAPDEVKDPKDPGKAGAPKYVQKKLTKQEAENVEASYRLASDFFDKGKYREAMFELEAIFQITPEYKNSRQLHDLAKEGLAKIEQLEEQRRKEIERKERLEKSATLVRKAKEAIKELKMDLAESLFPEILKLDPENYDVPQMKIEIESYRREQERIANEQAMKEADRVRKVNQLAPGKGFYIKKEWYKAIVKLDEFVRVTPMDEDLMKEGVEMLADAKAQLQNVVSPLIGKARSLKEGQDLKGAYETYLQIIAYDPMNVEALNEMAEIRDTLYSRARKIYREAIISESLSLFEDAKEKFQEVQQISPSDSEYYKKASDKLKDYTD